MAESRSNVILTKTLEPKIPGYQMLGALIKEILQTLGESVYCKAEKARTCITDFSIEGVD